MTVCLDPDLSMDRVSISQKIDSPERLIVAYVKIHVSGSASLIIKPFRKRCVYVFPRCDVSCMTTAFSPDRLSLLASAPKSIWNRKKKKLEKKKVFKI